MKIPISQQTRKEVITKWLSGWPRDKIAGEFGIGAGTVSKITNLWIQEIGAPTAESFRELSIEIRRSGISIRECARGLRFIRFLQGISGEEETKQIEIFLEKIYNKSKYFNVPPENLVEIVSEIWELSKTMPTTEISSFLNAKMKEKEKIESEINELNKKRDFFDSDLNRRFQAAQTDLQELQNFVMSRRYFESQNVNINDLYRLTTALQNAIIFDFNINQIAQKISGNMSLAAEEANLRKRIEQRLDELKTIENSIQVTASHADELVSKMTYFKELESMGFGMNEFIGIKRMLVAMAGDNKSEDLAKDPAVVVKSFFAKIEELRNVEAKLESLKEESRRIEELRKSQIDDMKEFMSKLKAEIKEVSDTAIRTVNQAFHKSDGAVGSEISDKSNS